MSYANLFNHTPNLYGIMKRRRSKDLRLFMLY